ncbi:MAG TPA: 4-hydroxy-tetrahydrodipicolinate reductase, partial [Pirellulales bacterium]
MAIRIAIHGAAGRMGQRLIALAAADKQFILAAAVDRPGNPKLGEDAGQLAGVGTLGVPLTDSLPNNKIDVVIDFSGPAAAVAIARECQKRGLPLVV